MSKSMICSICGEETHDDTSTLFDVFTLAGVTQERRCFDCGSPEGDDY